MLLRRVSRGEKASDEGLAPKGKCVEQQWPHGRVWRKLSALSRISHGHQASSRLSSGLRRCRRRLSGCGSLPGVSKYMCSTARTCAIRASSDAHSCSDLCATRVLQLHIASEHLIIRMLTHWFRSKMSKI
jgi:hypothetical protein